MGAGVRVASLRAHAVHVLRYKIAEEYASRHLSLASELEQAIGKSIVAIRSLSHSRKKGVTIALDLDDGTGLQLAAKADPVDAPGETSAEGRLGAGD